MVGDSPDSREQDIIEPTSINGGVCRKVVLHGPGMRVERHLLSAGRLTARRRDMVKVPLRLQRGNDQWCDAESESGCQTRCAEARA